MTAPGCSSGPRVIVALDYATAGEALAFAARVTPAQCRLKIGFELFTAAGPTVVEALVKQGFDVFLDLKFHDIPNTVARACSAAAALGVWMINVHALGGRAMMEAASESLARIAKRPLLIAVTLLTSHSRKEISEIGLDDEPAQEVLALARLARASGLDGVVCSAQEAGVLRSGIAQPFCLVTPGIRLSGSDVDDQQRVMTPSAAIQAGADYLVVGRPITKASDPLAVLLKINHELDAAIVGM